MATSAEAVFALALYEYKQLLDKHVSLLQLTNMVDEEETTRGNRFSLSPYFTVYKKQRRLGVMFTL